MLEDTEKEKPDDPAKEKDDATEEEKEPKSSEDAMNDMRSEVLDNFSKTFKGLPKMDADKEAKDDDDEFQRDDDQSEIQNIETGVPAPEKEQEKSSLLDEKDQDEKQEDVLDDDDDTPVKKVREAATTKVEVFMPKGEKPQMQDEAQEPEENVNKNYFLDLLFSFIGVSSEDNCLEELQRVKLNLFSVHSDVSRTPPGEPTPMADENDPGFNILAKRERDEAASPQFGGDPKLL